MLLAFLLLQAHKLHGNGLTYQVMNIVGALGVMLSLLFGSFNLPAFVDGGGMGGDRRLRHRRSTRTAENVRRALTRGRCMKAA